VFSSIGALLIVVAIVLVSLKDKHLIQKKE
jgi:hypothetical protein